MLERDERVAKIRRMLEDSGRVLVTGAPGVGKSWVLGRLADVLEDVILVDASSAHREADLLELLSDALGVGPGVSEPGVRHERLATRLEELGPRLVAIDNARPMDCTRVDSLLGSSSCKVIMATCRAISLEGWSHVWLRSFDALEPSSELSDALDHPGVSLLVRAARMNHTDWSMRQSDVADVAAIIDALGGYPAALDVIGQRLPAFGAQALAASLARPPLPEYLDVALVDWWNELGEDVAVWVRAAATFQGSFDAHAYEMLLGDDVFDALMELRALSLLECDDSASAPTYSMHPFLKAFCTRRMEPEEREAMRDHHAEAFIELSKACLKRSRAKRFGPSTEHIASLASDIEHALEYTKARGDREGTTWLLAAQAIGCWRAGSFERVDAALNEAGTNEELATLSAEAHGVIALLRSDAGILRWSANEARKKLEEAQASRDDWPASMMLEFGVRRADIMTELNDPNVSSYNDEILSLARDNKDLFAEAITLLSVGYYTFKRGDFMNAAGIMNEGIDILTELGFHREAARGRTNMGFCYWKLEKPEKAYAAFEESIELFDRVGDVVSVCHALRILSDYLIDEGEFERAKDVLERLLGVGKDSGLGWARGAARHHLAQIALERAEYDDALMHSASAVISLERDRRIPWVIGSLFQQLWAALFLEDEDAARVSLERILSLREHMSSKLGRALIVCFEAESIARRGETSAALASLGDAKLELASEAYNSVEHLIELFECIVLATRYVSLNAKRKRVATLDELMSILSRLLHPQRKDQVLAPVDHGSELRLAFRLLRQRLPDEAAPYLEDRMSCPKTPALLIDTERRMFRGPHATKWVDMSRRETPFRLLETLIMGGLERPGEPLEAEVLINATWPDEEILPKAALNRLHVTLSTLRSLGLKGCILSKPGGYMIDSAVPLILV